MDYVMKKMLENHSTKLDGQVAQSLGTILLDFIAETAETSLTILTNLHAVKWLQVQNIENSGSLSIGVHYRFLTESNFLYIQYVS